MKCRECRTETKIKTHELIEALPGKIDESDWIVKLETVCGHVYTATVFHEDKALFAAEHQEEGRP